MELDKLERQLQQKKQIEQAKRQEFVNSQKSLLVRLKLLQKVRVYIKPPNKGKCPDCRLRLLVQKLQVEVKEPIQDRKWSTESFRVWDSGTHYSCTCGYEYGECSYRLQRKTYSLC